MKGYAAESCLEMSRSEGKSLWLDLVGLVLVLVVCAGIRIWLIQHSVMIARDGVHYIQIARDWQRDPAEVLENCRLHIGYPVAIVGVHALLAGLGYPDGLRGWELSGQAISLVSSLMALVALWIFARMAFDSRIAFISTLLFGVGRKWSILGADVLTDSLAVCLQMWAVVLALAVMVALKRGSKWSVFLAAWVGLLAGSAYLVRPEGFGVAFVAVFLWLWQLLKMRHRWRLTFLASMVTILVALTTAAPYMISTGSLTPERRISDFVLQSKGQPIRMVSAAVLSANQAHALREPVGRLLSDLVEALHPVVAVLSCVWLVSWIGSRIPRIRLPEAVRVFPRGPCAMAMVVVTAGLVVILMAYHRKGHPISSRYLTFPAMLLSPLAGAGMLIIAEWIRMIWQGLARSRLGRWGIAAPLMAVVVGGMLCHTLRPLHPDKAYYRKAGEFIGTLLGPNERLLAPHGWVLHYARYHNEVVKGSTFGLSYSPRAFYSCLRSSNVTHLALSDRNMADLKSAVVAIICSPIFVQIAEFSQDKKSDPDIIRIYRINRKMLEST